MGISDIPGLAGNLSAEQPAVAYQSPQMGVRWTLGLLNENILAICIRNHQATTAGLIRHGEPEAGHSGGDGGEGDCAGIVL